MESPVAFKSSSLSDGLGQSTIQLVMQCVRLRTSEEVTKDWSNSMKCANVCRCECPLHVLCGLTTQVAGVH